MTYIIRETKLDRAEEVLADDDLAQHTIEQIRNGSPVPTKNWEKLYAKLVVADEHELGRTFGIAFWGSSHTKADQMQSPETHEPRNYAQYKVKADKEEA